MKLFYLSDESYNRLLNNLTLNENYYIDPTSSIEDILFEEDVIESSVMVDNVKLIYGNEGQKPREKIKNDLSNTISLYSGFIILNPHLATNKNLWAYLSHTVFREYVLDRWTFKNKGDEEKYYSGIKSRYFIGPKRYLFDNAISRLWWFGYLTYDSENKFELTKIMLMSQQICMDFLDISCSRNRELGKGILKALKLFNENFPDADIHKCFRECKKSINRYGAVTLIDILSETEMQNLAYNYLVNAHKKFKN